ncbi:MAG: 1,4-dihydroxy-2-naphthoate octaprenyltransferase [Rhodothermales bacterium]|jgi:1,4-dihydroxy-2-naphthoate octaprenyltransferase
MTGGVPVPEPALLPPLRVLLTAARPKTLWAAASPVIIGWGLALGDGVFHLLAAVLALAGALLIQVATNYHNDYADYLKGTDKADRAGPRRVTAAGLATPAQMKRATVLVFAIAVLSGVYLMARGGLPIVAIGASSILFGVLYTAGKHSLAYLGIADVFVLIFFGPVAVGGTYWVQALEMRPEILIAGAAPGLLSMAILLVNNIRDIQDDGAAGKRTLVVRAGRTFGITLYALSVGLAAATPVVLWLGGSGRPWAMVAALILIPAIPLVKTLHAGGPSALLNPVLGKTAQLLLFYALLFNLGWLLS